MSDSSEAKDRYTLFKADSNGEAPCAFFNRPGGCKNGDDCRFVHSSNPSSPSPGKAPSSTTKTPSSNDVPSNNTSDVGIDWMIKSPQGGDNDSGKKLSSKKSKKNNKKRSLSSVLEEMKTENNSSTNVTTNSNENFIITSNTVDQKKKRRKNDKQSFQKMEESDSLSSSSSEAEEEEEEEKSRQVKKQQPQNKKKKTNQKKNNNNNQQEKEEEESEVCMEMKSGCDGLLEEMMNWLRDQKVFRDRYQFNVDNSWIKTPQIFADRGEEEGEEDGLKMVGIDCEMCETEDPITKERRNELIRVSLVTSPNPNLDPLLDLFVRPENPIKDMRSRIHHLTQEEVMEKGVSMRIAQSKILELLTPKTIIAGHSLENDFKALKILHPLIIDTSILFGVERIVDTSKKNHRKEKEEIDGKKMVEDEEENEKEEVKIGSPALIDVVSLILPKVETKVLITQYIQSKSDATNFNKEKELNGNRNKEEEEKIDGKNQEEEEEDGEEKKGRWSLHNSVTDAQLTLLGAFHLINTVKSTNQQDIKEILPIIVPRAVPRSSITKNPKSSTNSYQANNHKSLLIHRIPPHVTSEDIQTMFEVSTHVIPTTVQDVQFKPNINNQKQAGKCVVEFRSSDHATLAFESFLTELRHDQQSFPQKRVYFKDGGGYIVVRRMVRDLAHKNAKNGGEGGGGVGGDGGKRKSNQQDQPTTSEGRNLFKEN